MVGNHENAGSNPAVPTGNPCHTARRAPYVGVGRGRERKPRCPGGPARSGRHPLKVKSVGSNPIQGTAEDVSAGHRRAQAAVTRPRTLCRFDSCPTRSTPPAPAGAPSQVVERETRGPQKAVPTRREGSTPSLATACPGGEGDITRPSEGRDPGSTPGRGTVLASMVKRTSRGPAKAEFLVRVQVGALWPNSKRQRDPAVNRGCAGSTPAGCSGDRAQRQKHTNHRL